jgi:ketosteroid isomerase-like protein
VPGGEAPDPDILQGLEKFFSALRSMFAGKLGPMARIWANSNDVTFAGPTGNIQVGWEAVLGEFERHGRQTIRGNLGYKAPFIRTFGDMAYASCLATAPDMTINGKPYPFNQRATSLFRRQDDGEWRLVHHHTDFAPGLAELCGGTEKR